MNWERDKTLIVLCAFILVFAGTTMTVVALWKDDGQIYTLFAGAFNQFVGGLMMYLKMNNSPAPGSTTITSTSQVTQTPEETK